jgi:hypothetical protein
MQPALPMIRNSRSLRNACSLLCIVLIVLFLERKIGVSYASRPSTPLPFTPSRPGRLLRPVPPHVAPGHSGTGRSAQLAGTATRRRRCAPSIHAGSAARQSGDWTRRANAPAPARLCRHRGGATRLWPRPVAAPCKDKTRNGYHLADGQGLEKVQISATGLQKDYLTPGPEEPLECGGWRGALACGGWRGALACGGWRGALACGGWRGARACGGWRGARACGGWRGALACGGWRGARACGGWRGLQGPLQAHLHRPVAAPCEAAPRATARRWPTHRSYWTRRYHVPLQWTETQRRGTRRGAAQCRRAQRGATERRDREASVTGRARRARPLWCRPRDSRGRRCRGPLV